MSLLKRLSDNRNPRSLAVQLRRRRFALFEELLSDIERPLKILDVGGTELFWRQMGFGDESGVSIIVLNASEEELSQSGEGGGQTKFETLLGDGCSMPEFSDNEFDVVFSNSVLEHVGGLNQQRSMMEEVQRVGKRFFVQTPNFFFPIEPHFHLFGFQFLPVPVRAWLLCHFDLGWTQKAGNSVEAERIVRSVQLLTRGQLLRICPLAEIRKERFLGFAKSFILLGGW